MLPGQSSEPDRFSLPGQNVPLKFSFPGQVRVLFSLPGQIPDRFSLPGQLEADSPAVNKIAVVNDKIAKDFFIKIPLLFRLHESDFVARKFWLETCLFSRIKYGMKPLFRPKLFVFLENIRVRFQLL